MEESSVGERFARALARKDHAELGRLLADNVDFRGMTPRRVFEESTSAGVIERAIKVWFDDGARIESLLSVETGRVGDRHSVRYRVRVRNDRGLFDVEQQVYFEVEEQRIAWMRLLCSGYLRVRA